MPGCSSGFRGRSDGTGRRPAHSDCRWWSGGSPRADEARYKLDAAPSPCDESFVGHGLVGTTW